MANKRREENFRKSGGEDVQRYSNRGGMGQREETHREPKYKGEGKEGERSRTSGSIAHIGETFGPGPVAGAGELMSRPGSRLEPKSGMEEKSGMPEDRYPSRKTPSAKEKVSMRSRGQEEDE